MGAERDPRKYAVDMMVEVAKQLITLASGGLVLSLSLLGLMTQKAVAVHSFWLIVVTWVSILLSVFSGLLGLGAIAAHAHVHNTFDVDETMTRSLLRAQQLAFIVAFGAFVWFGIVNRPSAAAKGAGTAVCQADRKPEKTPVRTAVPSLPNPPARPGPTGAPNVPLPSR
jgi:hypothetical protein